MLAKYDDPRLFYVPECELRYCVYVRELLGQSRVVALAGVNLWVTILNVNGLGPAAKKIFVQNTQISTVFSTKVLTNVISWARLWQVIVIWWILTLT